MLITRYKYIKHLNFKPRKKYKQISMDTIQKANYSHSFNQISEYNWNFIFQFLELLLGTDTITS